MGLTFDQITAITNDYFMDKFPQLVFDQNLLQKRLAAKGTKPSSGESIRQPVIYQSSRGGSYSPFDTFDISAQDQVTAADFNWKYYEVPITISRDELLKNQGPEGVRKLLKAKMMAASLRMGDLLSTDMFGTGAASGSDTTTGLNTLDNMINDAGDTLGSGGADVYGGITKTGNTWWAGILTDAGGAGIGPHYERVNEAYYDVADGNITPTIVVGHNNSLASYLSQQQPQQQYMRQDEMDAGFLTAQFNGKTFVADLHVADGGSTVATNRLYLLNENFIDFVTHADENNRLEPFAKPVDQAVGIAHIMFAGELTSSDPSRSCVMRNFDSTDTTAS